MNKVKTISVRDFKILYTVLFLNDWRYYPSIKGVAKIINGILDEETEKLVNCPTFGSITSLSSRRLSFDVHRLVKEGYLEEEMDEENRIKILLITKDGKMAIDYFNKHHNLSLMRRKTKAVKTIIHR